MNEEARAALIAWARSHYAENGHPPPTVEITSLWQQDDDPAGLWSAEMEVNGSPNLRCVTFWKRVDGVQIEDVVY